MLCAELGKAMELCAMRWSNSHRSIDKLSTQQRWPFSAIISILVKAYGQSTLTSPGITHAPNNKYLTKLHAESSKFHIIKMFNRSNSDFGVLLGCPEAIRI